MNKICTSLEQSKKLIELGIDVNTADMAYWKRSYRPNDYAIMVHYTKELQEGFEAKGVEYIPAWSLAALLSVLPSVITRKGKRMFLTLEKAGAYNLYYKSPDRLDEIWETKEDVIDACYEMIINLHELKLL